VLGSLAAHASFFWWRNTFFTLQPAHLTVLQSLLLLGSCVTPGSRRAGLAWPVGLLLGSTHACNAIFLVSALRHACISMHSPLQPESASSIMLCRAMLGPSDACFTSAALSHTCCLMCCSCRSEEPECDGKTSVHVPCLSCLMQALPPTQD